MTIWDSVPYLLHQLPKASNVTKPQYQAHSDFCQSLCTDEQYPHSRGRTVLKGRQMYLYPCGSLEGDK